MKISLLFGKKAESILGKSGYVLRVNAIGNDIAGFTCADGDEREFFIPVRNIKSIKNTVSYTDAGKPEGDLTSLTLGKPVYDCEGNFIGNLSEIVTEKYRIISFVVGNKKFSADDIICGDAVIIKNSVKILKSDVKKKGRIIFRKGTPVTDEIEKKARLVGEYVQTNLKAIR